MSFDNSGFGGGGSSGSASTVDHVHNSVAGQGGALDGTSLVNSKLINTHTQLEILETYHPTGTFSSKTFDFSASPLNLDTDYDYLLLSISGFTTASLEGKLELNSIAGTNYSWWINKIQSAVTVVTTAGSQAYAKLWDTTWVGINDISIVYRITARPDLARFNIVEEGGSVGIDNFPLGFRYCIDSDADGLIDTIKFSTSTSTMKADSRITVYGVRVA